ncbi:hypothetical protein CcaCcLH18_08199 [Colletotrichum camelliae]|nr:hypothetical protein CcaCcLH18_08199 [Colletotrichum camelliae]
MYHGAKSSVWTSKSVFFLLMGSRIIEAYNPYVPFQLALDPVSESIELAHTLKFPVLVAFGRLLLEIALGRPIQDAELNELCSVTVVSLDIIMTQQDEEIRNNVTKGYCKAMTKCLQSNRDDDYDDSDAEESEKEDADAEDHHLEEVIVSVIEHLERDRDEFPKFDNHNSDWEQPNFPMVLELEETENAIASNMGPRFTNTFKQTNGAFQSKNTGVLESPHQLFDAISRSGKDMSVKY